MNSTQRKSILILGVGSPFGADRLGWQAVDFLAQQQLAVQFPSLDIRCEKSDRPGSRLLTLIGQADATLIIDAMRSGAPAGSVRRFAAEELDADSGLLSSHGFGVVEALALARALDGALPGQLVVLGIEMAADGASGEAPPESLAALGRRVQAELGRWTGRA